MALYKKKELEEGTVRITGKELETTYESDPEGRFEIITGWGHKELFRDEDGRWYIAHSGKSRAVFSQEEINELPEILYTHSAFLSKE